MNNNVKPIFKYIGGKTWLKASLEKEIDKFTDKRINTYSEPFCGGLGAFLSVSDILLKKDIFNIELNDINKQIINVYKNIKNNEKDLIFEIIEIEKGFCKTIINSNKEKKDLIFAEEYFKKIKKEFNLQKENLNIKQAAKIVFLQKHSFNGIYRENLKGEYNTPFNWSPNNMINSIEDRILELKKLFNSFDIKFNSKSFEKIEFNKNSIYYLDPPYANENKNENKYNKNSFNMDKQIILINLIKEKNYIYSNHATKEILSIFKSINPTNLEIINRKNTISAKKETRKNEINEILVTNILTRF